jgi:DNA-binding transcriptional MerR regulator
MSLAELADASGIPARTIRFYIARGLLDGPVKGGRAAVYSDEHLAILERILKLQSAGHTLAEIARTLAAPSARQVPPTPWWQYAIADDVVVMVSAAASPWRMKEIQAAVNELAQRLQPPKEGKE